MDYNSPDLKTKFNAGIDIAQEISLYVQNCANHSRNNNYYSWWNELQIIQRRMPKILHKKEAINELRQIAEQYKETWTIYLRKLSKGKKIRSELSDSVRNLLSLYESKLLFWRDELGYGMPEEEDMGKAAFR